jgi:hypothetical protein
VPGFVAFHPLDRFRLGWKHDPYARATPVAVSVTATTKPRSLPPPRSVRMTCSLHECGRQKQHRHRITLLGEPITNFEGPEALHYPRRPCASHAVRRLCASCAGRQSRAGHAFGLTRAVPKLLHIGNVSESFSRQIIYSTARASCNRSAHRPHYFSFGGCIEGASQASDGFHS